MGSRDICSRHRTLIIPTHHAARAQVITSFCAFLLEQLSKEAREASREAARDAVAAVDAAKRRAAQRERELLVGARPTSTKGDGHTKEEKLSLDALVARQYAERLAAAAEEVRPAAGSTVDKEVAAPAAVSSSGAPNVFEELFQAEWEEVFSFHGVNPATGQRIAPVTREATSLVLPLTLPEEAAGQSMPRAASQTELTEDDVVDKGGEDVGERASEGRHLWPNPGHSSQHLLIVSASTPRLALGVPSSASTK